jgi:dynein light chain LC8-type
LFIAPIQLQQIPETKVEIDFNMAEQRKAVIKNADMSEPMQQDAVDIASVALSKYNIEKVSAQNFFLCRNHLIVL